MRDSESCIGSTDRTSEDAMACCSETPGWHGDEGMEAWSWWPGEESRGSREVGVLELSRG